ncbi:trypsin-like peptidase domain-containing protein [Streptomyces sp. NPDC048565]|uniref:S1C family serine protease n=1 Tax=Streptomyces sp. NPDC048565 TaxID=3155266 RepID=UPI003428CA17
MDDGKPSGPKTKWWSRPSTERSRPAGPEDAVPTAAAEPPAPVPASDPAAGTADGDHTPADPVVRTADGDYMPAPPAPAAEPPAHRTQPLHAPDEYSTPPYGGPGPWAPAPPVQRPAPTPAQGTPVPAPGTHVPPPYSGTDGHGVAATPPPPPHTVPQQPTAPPPAQAAPGPQQGPQQPSQWLRYDPWGVPQQPLSHPGPGQGTEARPRGGRRGSFLLGAVLLALVAGGIGGGIGSYVERNGGLTTVELPQADRDNGGRAPDSVAGIAASALPGVVTLRVNGTAESGTGTGFVLDDKGHILTNNHVVAPAGSTGEITVTFSSGESVPAELVGKDSGYDLAVVKVNGVSGLKPLPLGNSDNVQVGDPVVAIGAPFDLSNTVTSGIISAKQRPITAGGEKGDGSDVSYVDALQTDAPINPGNSGGPLVDAEARAIGINSAIRAADSGSAADGSQSGSIGLGFAIPINQGKRVAEELINTGKATHPVIGVTLDMEFTGDGAKVGGEGADGTAAVTEGGPADKAGIRSGDIITEVEGRRVHSGEELIIKIRAHRPGDRLGLVLTRGGKDLSVTLTLGSASGT